jgi:hypothetical protein
MTKSVKLIILTIIIVFLVYLAYSVYFTSKEGTETFSKFDVNSTASKNIRVELVQEKGITPNPEGGVTFFVKDKSGIEKKVMLGKELPQGINNSKSLTLTGHLHGDYFHATEAEVD